jgi:hypothetical protein
MCLRGGGVFHNRRTSSTLLLKYLRISEDGGVVLIFPDTDSDLWGELNH